MQTVQMTASIAAGQQGVAGNYATAGPKRKRGGQRSKRNREKWRRKNVVLSVGTLNVGTMTGKDRNWQI